MRIYVASSWRNLDQPNVVEELRAAGHEVYDFRHPHIGPGKRGQGFHWSAIDEQWQSWTSAAFRDALQVREAQDGFASDFEAMQWADACVLVLPCGRSAHLELGWAWGAGKRTAILMADDQEPELMYLGAERICLDVDELISTLFDWEYPQAGEAVAS